VHATRATFDLGSYVVGEVPPPLIYHFVDANGGAINLTGFTTTTFQWGELIQGQFVNPVVASASVTDAINGGVTHTWTGDEFDAPGEYAALFYVNDGTTQYASTLLTWHVCLAVGVPPDV
jgi:hypothetical protein